jgi:hypothetical protein
MTSSSSPLNLFERPSLNAAPPNGGGAVLLLLVAILFASLWTLFDILSVAVLLTALGVGAALRRWHDRHPATEYTGGEYRRERTVVLPQINISAVSVGGDVGGMLFASAALLAFIIGLPAMRTFAAASLVCGLVVAVALIFRHRTLAPGVTHVTP